MSFVCIFFAVLGAQFERLTISTTFSDDTTGNPSIKDLDESPQSLSQEERLSKQRGAWTLQGDWRTKGPRRQLHNFAVGHP